MKDDDSLHRQRFYVCCLILDCGSKEYIFTCYSYFYIMLGDIKLQLNFYFFLTTQEEPCDVLFFLD